MKEQNPLYLENIADLLWLFKFTGMQSVVAGNTEDKKKEKPKKNPKIEDDKNSSEPEMEKLQDNLEVHTNNQDDENSSHTKQKKQRLFSLLKSWLFQIIVSGRRHLNL